MRPITTGMKGFKGPLLQRVISSGQSPPVSSITILTKPERAREHSVLPTTYEEVTPTSLSTICRPSSRPTLSFKDILRKAGARLLPSVSRSRSPLHIAILSDPEKEKREAHPQGPKSNLISPSRTRSLPSVSQSHSPPHITILSNPEREKRETHPHPPPKPKSIPLNPASSYSLRQSLSPAHTTIISNPKKEKREAHPRSTQRTKSFWNSLAALSPKRVPTVTFTPISILKARTPPPQISAPAPAADPNPDSVKGNVKIWYQLSDIVVQERVRDPETSTGSDAVLTSKGEMLGVPVVDWRRRRVSKEELGLEYPDEPFNRQFERKLGSIMRNGNRAAAARRRDYARRRRQTATTATATTALSLHGPHRQPHTMDFHSYYTNRQRLRSVLPQKGNCLNPLCGTYSLPHTCIQPGNHLVRAS